MKEWEKRVYREISIYSEGAPGDVKLVWELSRHQYFVTLGQAFYLSGDRAYLDELVAQWLNWIEENPCTIGINWASPLEIGVRLISWTLAFQFIEDHLPKTVRTTILNSVWEQLTFLSYHLSLDKIVPTNHLIGEAAGLFIAACSFRFDESDRWGHRAQRILEEEILRQVFDDGISKEESSSYHRFNVDFFLLSFIRAVRSGHPFSEDYKGRLEKMIGYLFAIRTPDSLLPRYGDFDNGRGFSLSPSVNFWDVRGLIAAGGALFKNEAFSDESFFNEEAYWLLSSSEWEGKGKNRSVVPSESGTIFPRSGHVVIKNQHYGEYCFFRAGEFGMGGNGFSSHSHNDLFSPVIYLNGCSIIAETGTSIYVGNDQERDYLRSARAHNVTISPASDFFESKRWFGWKRSLNGRIIGSMQTRKEIRVECGFDGPFADLYKRSIRYEPDHHLFAVEESFTKNVPEVHSYFHLEHGITVSAKEGNADIVLNNRTIAHCLFPPSVHLTTEQGWISRSYGIKESSVIIHFTWHAEAGKPVIFSFIALPA